MAGYISDCWLELPWQGDAMEECGKGEGEWSEGKKEKKTATSESLTACKHFCMYILFSE